MESPGDRSSSAHCSATPAAARAAFATPTANRPPVPLTGRALGQGITLEMHTDQASNTWISTATLTFADTGGDRTFSIDFVTQFPAAEQRPARSRAVDMIVSEHQPTEKTPAMSMRLNGVESLPVTPRFHTSRSVVATLSFDEFLRLADATTV